MKCSIVIPIYNVENYIENCLRSVVQQKGCDLECVLVDDGSKDRSMEVVNSFLENYKGNVDFKIVSYGENRGQSVARNTGIKEASGEYLFFLDSDDELAPDAMITFMRYMEKFGRVDFFVGNFEVVGSYAHSGLRSKEFVNSPQDILFSYMKNEWYVMPWGKLICREFLLQNNLWFMEGLLNEDELFSFQFAMAASTMVTVKENVYRYIVRSNSLTSNKGERNFKDYVWILAENMRLVQQRIPASEMQSFYLYFTSSCYGYVMSILTSNNLTFSQKKVLMKKMQELLPLVSLMKQTDTVKTKLEHIILRSPFCFVFFVIKLHALLRGKD